jgi:hypothetical protein
MRGRLVGQPLACPHHLVEAVGVRAFRGWDRLEISETREARAALRNRLFALNAAIARYEGNPDLPDSVLSEADQRAYEALHVKRIRTAPAWILCGRRRCRLRVFGWSSPSQLWAAFLVAFLIFRWRWIPFDHFLVLLALACILQLSAESKTRGLIKARNILGEAIERYEYESAATESDLEEADRRASAVLPGRSEPSRPAA